MAATLIFGAFGRCQRACEGSVLVRGILAGTEWGHIHIGDAVKANQPDKKANWPEKLNAVQGIDPWAESPNVREGEITDR